MAKASLPKFDAPPVIETALSVQFSRLIGFSTPMAGWFWKSYLNAASDKKWEKATEATRLMDAFEKFGDQEARGRFALRISRQFETNRVQLIEAGDGSSSRQPLYPELEEEIRAISEFRRTV